MAAIDDSALTFTNLELAHWPARKFYFRKASHGDAEAIKQIFGQRDYDLRRFGITPRLERFERAHAPKNLLVVDAGANIGAAAVYFSDFVPRARVCALEPEPHNYALLQRNILGLPVIALQCALANATRPLWLHDPGHGDLGFRVGDKPTGTVTHAVDIPTVLARYNPADTVPYICKIDIEGGEEMLFSSNDAWLDRFAVVIIELHDWMLPGTSNSRNFLAAIARRHFDVRWYGENMFCFNNDLLKS
jgi:FkbM family methyltransferase